MSLRKVCQVIDRLYRRRLPVAVGCPGKETADVEGNVFAAALLRIDIGQGGDIGRNFFHLLIAVIHVRNDERCKLHMTGLHSPLNEGFHIGKVPLQNITVDVFTEAFEVNIHGIHVGQNLFQYMQRYTAVCHQNVKKSGFMDEAGRIPDIFMSHERFIICVGNAYISLIFTGDGQRTQFFRGNRTGLDNRLSRIGNFIVLAEGAVEVAAEGTNGKDKASRVKAAQGLLLNRIQRKSGKKAVVQRDYCLQSDGSGGSRSGM